MKKLLFLLLSLFVVQSYAQRTGEIYSFANGRIQRNDTSYVSTHLQEPDEKVKPYQLVRATSFVANAKTYELKVLNYNGWEGDGGDFRVIRLYDKERLMLEFVDEEAWQIGRKEEENNYAPPFSGFREEIEKYAVCNDHYVVYPLADNATALLFEGFSWSSQVPLLTIIVIKDDKAEVVFNQQWGVEFFHAEPKGFELVLMANFLEWTDVPCYDSWYPDRHKIYTTSKGTMKFEKVSEDDEKCSLAFLTKGPWVFRHSKENGFTEEDEACRMKMKFSDTTLTSIHESEKGETVHRARYFLSDTVQSSFDESKVGQSLHGNYICVEDSATNGVANYEIKGYTFDMLTLKKVDNKLPADTDTFYRITR